jgi:SAM-dependent methyltransferase
VIAWDSSRLLLEELFPAVVELVGGRLDKIERVCGDFLPLMLDDGAVSAVVMSSAFHHSPEPERLLGELVRVVEPAGPVLLVNETPWNRARMASFAARISLRVIADAARGSGRPPRGPSVGFGHALYDAELGDRAYTMAQWRAMFALADVEATVIDSGLAPYKPAFRSRAYLEANLTHVLLYRRTADR